MRRRLKMALISLLLATPAAADWRLAFPVFRIGIVTGSATSTTLPAYEPFRAYMEDVIGVPVELIPAPNLAALIDAHTSKRVHYAVYSASAYAVAWTMCKCIEPLVAPRASDGSLGYHAIIVARDGGSIGAMKDLENKKIAYSISGSVAGHLVPVAEMRRAGIDPQTYFSTSVHAASSRAGVKAVLEGDVAAATAWSSLQGAKNKGYSRGTLRDLTDTGELDPAMLRIIWKSRQIPHGPHAVLNQLPPKLLSLLRQSLLAIDLEDPAAYDAVERHLGGGFAVVGHDEYGPLLDMIKPEHIKKAAK